MRFFRTNRSSATPPPGHVGLQRLDRARQILKVSERQGRDLQVQLSQLHKDRERMRVERMHARAASSGAAPAAERRGSGEKVNKRTP